MPKYRVETSQGTFEVESDKEPTQQDLDRYLAGTTSTRRQAAPMVNRDNQAGKDGGAGLGTAIDIGLEAGLPLAAQAATAPGTGIGITSAIGASASVLGNMLAQTRRLIAGEQDNYSAGQLAQAAATGAVPFAGPAAKLAESSRPVLRSIVQMGKEGFKQAGVGLGGEAIKVAIDEGRMPTGGEAAMSAMIPGAIGGGASAIGSIAKGIVTRGQRVAENLADYGSVRATPGMLLPEDLARTEHNISTARPGSRTAGRVTDAYQDVSDQVQSIAPAPREGAEIFKTASPLIGQISSAEKELAKLNGAAQDATDRARKALGKVRGATEQMDREAGDAGFKAAQKASDEAFDANLSSALENAKELAVGRVTGGAKGIDSATARTLFVEHVAKPVEAAFEEKSAQMYSLVDGEKKAFSAKPIIDQAEYLASKASGKLPAKLQSSVNSVKDMLGDGVELVSLQDLRNARAELLKKVQLGEMSSYEEKMIKAVAHGITEQIDQQAAKALGEAGGEALKSANKFYAETRPLFNNRGVDVLFSTGTADEFSRTMLAGMEKAGVNSDEYKNLQKLIDKIGEFNPELKTAAQAHVQDTLRRSVIFDASHVSPSSATGELVVDADALVKRLDQMARVPGTLEALNLGTPAKVAELKKLMGKYPEAAKLSSAQWTDLMESDAFRSATASGELSVQLAPVLATSQAEAQLVKAANLRAGGKVERANEAYNAALDTVRSIHGDVGAAQAKYEALLKDPTAIALNNPGIGSKGFNDFANSLFNPKANALTNTDVRAVVSGLESSPMPANRALLERLRERYIADKIAAYHSAPPTSSMLQHPDADAVALFFNPVNAADATNEIARARALLSSEQLNALSAFARTAKSVREYEAFRTIRDKPGSYNIPVVGEIRRGLDAVADLYREGKYEVAAKLLSNPSAFSRTAIRVGEAGQSASRGLGTAAQGAGRAIDARN